MVLSIIWSSLRRGLNKFTIYKLVGNLYQTGSNVVQCSQHSKIMEKELSHSFNIELSQEILRRLRDEQDRLLSRFKEQRLYESSPHLSIANKFMDAVTTSKFVEALTKEFENDKSWELEFTDFRPSSTNDYIFLHLSPESRQKLLNLHERAFTVTKNIGLETPSESKFRHFQYDPHISIIKLAPEDMEAAISLIKEDFVGVKMPVTQYVITQQADDKEGFSYFPVICEVNLTNH